MASYDIAGFASYQVDTSNNNSFFEGTTDFDVTLDDQEPDTTWEEGDTVLNYTSTPSNDYLGTIQVPRAGGGTETLVLLRGLATYTDPNVIQVLLIIPAGSSFTDYVIPDPIDFAGRSTADFTVCFARGTLIATPDGHRSVETLDIGDAILTADGRAVSVKWVGRQTVLTTFGPAERLMPVRFAAGSLGEGLPHADLTVTADHGMLIDGIICHAGALVNGETITTVPLEEMGPSYTVYHIETEEHEIILANGTPAETFIDNVSRRCFDNFAEFKALYGDVPEMEELDYPRAMSARQVPPRIKSMLDGRKAA
jgi:hypothetical protein